MKKTIRDVNATGKRVLVRVDWNVPLDEEGGILDDTRIKATLPTIEFLREQGAKVILVAHLGRPKGPDPKLSLAPIAKHASELMGVEVKMVASCLGREVQEAAHSLDAGEVLLLENVRFHPEEEKNEMEFAKALASLAELYVNDAFGTAHRAHASTAGVAAYLPSVAGFLMEKEITYLALAVLEPESPYAAVIGGAKVSTKMGVMENLMPKVDSLLIGGGWQHVPEGRGFRRRRFAGRGGVRRAGEARIDRADEEGVKLLLPADVIVAERFAADSPARRVSVKDVPGGWRIMDIGETTTDVFARALQGCKTVVWNGPMGVIEMGPFAHGSHRLAAVIANLKDATTIIGGGETAAIVEQVGLQGKFAHVSTAGGAALEFLEGKELPGVAALDDA